MQSFKDLEVYKASKKLAVLIYSTTLNWPKEMLYGLTDQIRRCSVSVPSNVAEGFGRVTSKDTYHFLAIARGSCYEVETQAELAFEFKFIDEAQLSEIIEAVHHTVRLINGTMNRYKTL